MAKGESYENFVEKFKPKKTTDDCYTPPLVYEAVKEWAINEFDWQGREIVRPFYPGRDYEHFDYPENCAVIDNPPFSIISKIAAFYKERGVDYMLFAPHLTLFNIHAAKSHIGVGVGITYDNGAVVNTSFIASAGAKIRSSPVLYQAIKHADEQNRAELRGGKALPKYVYPPNLMTSSKLEIYSKRGVDYRENRTEFVRALDAQRKKKKTVFGAGCLVPTPPVVPPVPPAPPVTPSDVWELSEREREIVKRLEQEEK